MLAVDWFSPRRRLACPKARFCAHRATPNQLFTGTGADLRCQSGFSLVELLVVILIIGILATLAIPRFLGQRDSAQDSKAKNTARLAYSSARAFMDGAGNGSFTGFAAALPNREPNLEVSGSAASASTDAPGSAANPNRVYVEVYGTGDVNFGVCTASRATRVWCIRYTDSSSQTEFFSGAGTVQAVWNGTASSMRSSTQQW